MSGNLQHALGWAARGFRVFPLQEGSKKPLFEKWDWTQGATGEPSTLERWWSQWPAANVGVLTDNFIVCDLDRKGGRDGIASFNALDYPKDTLVVRTPSGGLHVYYSGPNRANSVNRVAPGVDIRSYHGYVVAPGSWLDPAVPSNKGVGGVYELVRDLPVAAAPTTLVAALDAPTERHEDTRPVVELDLPDALVRAAAYARDVPPGVFGQGADAHTFNVACTLKDLGVSQVTATALLVEHYLPRCVAPRSEHEQLAWIERKVENAYAYGKNAPGSNSAQIEMGGIVPIEAPAPPPRPATKWLHHGDEWDRNVSWLFYEMLPSVGVGILTAPPNAGKTFVALELARCLATGKDFFLTPPDDRGGTLLLYAGSEGGGLAKRLDALGEVERLPIAACTVGVLGEQGALAATLADLQTKAAEMRAEYGVPVRLLVLETLSASGLLADENDNAQASAAMNALALIARAMNCFLLVTHHPPKEGKDLRGAGAIKGSADVVLEITRHGKETIRDLELTKAREASQRQLGSFTLLPVKLGVDDRGRDVVSMTVSTGAAAKRADPSSTFGALLVESFDWALIEKGENIEGHEVVEVEQLKAVFRDRKQGGREETTLTRAWEAAYAWAMSTGALKEVLFGGRRYVTRPVF